MVNLSYDPFQSVGATSGTANVPLAQSTGNQYQGDAMQDDMMFPYSGQTMAIPASVVFTSGIISIPNATSGVNGLKITQALGSGNAATVSAANASGFFAPAGFFLVQVDTSGNPLVKVPFFNS